MRHSREKYKTLSYSALFLALSIILSFVEAASGINSVIALPGVRLGLCNIALTACFYIVSRTGALAIAVVRPLFLFVLSGNPVSLAMSICGSVMAYISLLLTKRLYLKVFSYSGISCISALFHTIGQTAAAMVIMGDGAIVFYLPLFACLSSIMGAVLGFVMNLTLPRLQKAFERSVR